MDKLEKNGFVFNRGQSTLDCVQSGPDILGSTEIPVLSWIGDLGSGIISATQVDWSGAGLSFAGNIVTGLSQT